jgi:hypothetical protein
MKVIRFETPFLLKISALFVVILLAAVHPKNYMEEVKTKKEISFIHKVDLSSTENLSKEIKY